MGKRKRIIRKYEKVVPGRDKKKIVTGITTIDQALKDGVPSGVIKTVAGMGKTSYADTIRRQLHDNGEAIITLEMPPSHYEDKLKKK